MADFSEAYEITAGHEGGYSNDPDDAGGETYKGISRKYNLDWLGWPIIDASKNEPDFPDCLDYNGALQGIVYQFYKENYWDVFWGDDIHIQALANEMFDTGVNMGTGRAVRFLQEALNYLNRNEDIYPDVAEDGKFGNNTFNALNSYLANDDEGYLLKVMNVLQGKHYLDYMKKNPTQEKYVRGWMSRVEITKTYG